jgi:hypothetical protein
MSKRIRIPGLIDLVKIDDPEMVLSLNGNPALDRDVAPHGPLMNRMLPRVLKANLTFGGVLSPVMRARGDQERAQHSAELYRRLSDPEVMRTPDWQDCVLSLAAWLKSSGPELAAGIALQNLIGRLFVSGYVADEKSWQAAVDLDREVRAVSPFARARQKLTGALTLPRALLTEKAGGDATAVHATGIAIHNFIASLRAMRDLRAKGGTYTGEQAARLCRKAPKTALRQVSQPIELMPFGRLDRGTLVVFALDEAQAKTGDPKIAFLEGSWSGCPATRFSIRLMEAAWEAAQSSTI